MKNKKTQLTMKWVICLFIVFTFMQTSAQQNSITLTFSAIDSVSHENLTIDSVMIVNLSNSHSTIVQGPNPEITLVWTGLHKTPLQYDASFRATDCFPNPFCNRTTVAIDVNQPQELHLRLLSRTGNILAEMKDRFTPGRHLFRLSAGNQNIYFLSITGGGKSEVLKLISLSDGNNRIEYSGQQDLLKAGQQINEFDFNPGDTLQYSVYTTGYLMYIKTDTPTEDTDYTFELSPDPDIEIPQVEIGQIAAITQHSATCGATVTDDGGAYVTAKGVCWSTSQEPTVSDSSVTSGEGLGYYYSELFGLMPGTEYYVRAWATNVAGTSYSEETLSFMSGFATLYVPGEYQGWDPSVAPVVYDFDNDSVFTGYIFFPPAEPLEFKFTSAPSWDYTNYGYGGEGLLDTDPGAPNLSVPQPGGYSLEVDIKNLTWNYGYEVQNWGVIGEWLAWEEDIDMIWEMETQELSVTVEDIPAAENQRFKFRANDAWDYNLGATDPPDGQTLVPFGSDIPIPEGGTITFILRFTTPSPTYELIYR